MTDILIVEDNGYLLNTLKDQFGPGSGYTFTGAASIATARDALAVNIPDAVLLDTALPDGDGRDLCRWIRGKGWNMPILMLTERNGGMDSFDGLEAGADDYISKPVRLGDLLTRIRAHLEQHQANTETPVMVGPFAFSPASKTLAHPESGEVRPLTEKESGIIGYLAGKNGEIADKKELLREVWGFGERVTTHTLETHIYRLRRKMSDMDRTRVLLTDKDGYRLDS